MKANVQEQKSTRFVAGGVALALVAVVLLFLLSGGTGSGGVEDRLRRLRLPVGNRRVRQCSLAFIAYEPSEWEEEWRTKAEDYQQHTCKTMLEQKHLVDAWMEPMNATFMPGSAAATATAFQDAKVFSRFRYRDSCSGEEVVTPIEPLVGLLRHPTAGPFCQRPDRPDFTDVAHDPPNDQRNFGKWCAAHPDVDCGKTLPKERRTMENKGYMIMQPLPPDATAALYPGRKYLFDLGTGRFSSGSLPWFMSTFGARGIEFDEIFGWEITQIPDKEYWDEWPAHLSSKMHFRNLPCSVEPDDPRNPFNILRRIYKPGDYVAFKLDIDNEPIEQALLRQLDDSIISMIAEFFTEIHFDIPEMRGSFGFNLTTKLPAVIDEIQGFRMKGLRIHYWP